MGSEPSVGGGRRWIEWQGALRQGHRSETVGAQQADRREIARDPDPSLNRCEPGGAARQEGLSTRR